MTEVCLLLWEKLLTMSKKNTSFERTLLIKNIGDKAKNCPFLLGRRNLGKGMFLEVIFRLLNPTKGIIFFPLLVVHKWHQHFFKFIFKKTVFYLYICVHVCVVGVIVTWNNKFQSSYLYSLSYKYPRETYESIFSSSWLWVK